VYRFALIALALVVYVALCTPHRDSMWVADAWEHHRAIVALSNDLWHPPNPTYATDHPSIRYSPYSVLLALLVRATGIDAYHILSGAAVCNTVLLTVGIWLLLAAFREQSAGWYALIIMVGLYGAVPAYAGSYALADLPWHQVNPSAFSLPLALVVWAVFWRAARSKLTVWVWIALLALCTLSVLSHPMTAPPIFIGLFAMALLVHKVGRARRVGYVAVLAMAVLALCLLWPWYSFARALLMRQDITFWYSADFLKMMFQSWCLPAMIGAVCALPFRGRPLVRFALIGAVVSYGLALSAFILHSPTLARLPMSGLVFLHLATAVFFREARFFEYATWADRVRLLRQRELSKAATAILELGILGLLGFCLLPQVVQVPRSAHLARAYVAPLVGQQNKQLELKDKFDRLLIPVAQRDVVLSDLLTSWPIPSSRGRIVAALHLEYFVPGQDQRRSDLQSFFDVLDDEQRFQVLRRYNVRWIVLNRLDLDEAIFARLMEPTAVSNTVEYLTLMDANTWMAARRARRMGRE